MSDDCRKGRTIDGNGYDRGQCPLCRGDGCPEVWAASERVTPRRALEHYGREAQTDKAVEECAELVVALQKWKLCRGPDQIAAVIDELADVTIMLIQMSEVFGSEAVKTRVRAKLERLEQRMAQDRHDQRDVR